MRAAALLLTGLLCIAGAARAQDVPMGDPVAGLALARQTCAACHLVERGQAAPAAKGTAPAFTAIANTRAMTARALRVFLFTPHPSMPNLILSAQEADDVSAYILSLHTPR
jgi:mono/diheme cytochrome c family protein